MKRSFSAALLVAMVVALPVMAADDNNLAETAPTGAEYVSEREALQIFYKALGGAHWDRTDAWLTDAPLEDWYGVDVVGGDLVGLRLPDNNLTGELPDVLAELERLNHLDLRWNAIAGAIPASVGEMGALRTLLLTGNDLTGAVPGQLGSLSELQRLDLAHNSLTGEIPPQLGKLRFLQSIGLQNNELVGSIPNSLGGIDSLRKVVLNNNQLYGSVPKSLGETHGLKLEVQGNLLSDLVPESGKWNVKAANNRRSPTLYGVDVLEETTHIVGDKRVVEFMSDVMRAIEVRDGFLHLHDKILPGEVNAERMGAVIDGMNRRLVEKGKAIDSVSDLERVFELYSPVAMEVPSASPWEFRSDSNTRSPHSGRTPAGLTNCQDLRPHHVHLSRQRNGTYKIKGKFSGNCRVMYGPRDLSYTLYVSVGKRQSAWWWVWWQDLGTTRHVRGPEDPAQWSDSRAYAQISCPNSGQFRTQGRLYVVSPTLGEYFPYPGYFGGDARRLEC